MNILIIGCGKVGSRLADILCQIGHDVPLSRSNVKALTCCRMTFPASPFRVCRSTLTFCAGQVLKAVMPSQQSPKMITPTLWFARLPEKYSMFQKSLREFLTRCERIFSPFRYPVCLPNQHYRFFCLCHADRPHPDQTYYGRQ